MKQTFKVPKEELKARLREQLSFLVKSAAEYDKGDESEARRLSVHLRILLHHYGQSRALLQQLGIRDTIAFVDSCGPLSETNLLTEFPMVSIRQVGQGAPTYAPILGETAHFRPHKKIMFEKWWNNPIIWSKQHSVTFSRREIVLSVADQDGGAHVDPEIDAKYARLSRTQEFGWVARRDGIDSPIPLIELAHVRQISYETLVTLATKTPYAMPS